MPKKIKTDNLINVAEVKIIDLNIDNTCEQEMMALTEKDLLIILLTTDGFMSRGYRDKFSPFSKPSGFQGKYIFIRLDIPGESLLSELTTDINKIESIIHEYEALSSGTKVRVTTDRGTDITTQIASQELLPYHARALGGNAFLPPAEISEELEPSSTNGIIVVDITVREIRFGPDLIDSLGIVDSVELGHGLSDLSPTGIIGVDESMNGTCHFGIGNRNPYHVDVVISNPKFEVISE